MSQATVHITSDILILFFLQVGRTHICVSGVFLAASIADVLQQVCFITSQGGKILALRFLILPATSQLSIIIL